MIPKIKICCIQSIAEAELAMKHGASALGLVGRMPSGPGPIPDKRIAEVAQYTPAHIATFLLTSETTADRIIDHHRRVGTTTIQMVDYVPINDYAVIRNTLEGITLVQVIHVTGQESLDMALSVAPHVDMLLLDSGNPEARVRELGGTGRTHNWQISRKIVEQAGIPVFLAGGLNAGNVRQAIEQVRPYGVDLCSGVRTNGNLDWGKLTAFVAAVGN